MNTIGTARGERQVDQEGNISELELRLNRVVRGNGAIDVETCVIKKGPRAYKTITYSTFVDSDTGEVKKRELRGSTWPSKWNAPGFDFSKPDRVWHCENEEIEKVKAFLNDRAPEAGKYQLIKGGSDFAGLLKQVEAGGVNVGLLAKLVESARDMPAFVETLATSDHGQLLAEAVEFQRRRASLARLRSVVEDPGSSEDDIHKELKGHPWVFGGQFVGEAVRQELTTGDILDIPLLRADGTLHVVELKKAVIPKLIVRHRTHLIPGSDVHEAACQAQNYLRSLDEDRAGILAKYKIEYRRAFATVVIGHARFARDVDAREITETLRTYNSHQARIEVITFDQLLAAADQAIDFIEPVAPAQGVPDWDPWETSNDLPF